MNLTAKQKCQCLGVSLLFHELKLTACAKAKIVMTSLQLNKLFSKLSHPSHVYSYWSLSKILFCSRFWDWNLKAVVLFRNRMDCFSDGLEIDIASEHLDTERELSTTRFVWRIIFETSIPGHFGFLLVMKLLASICCSHDGECNWKSNLFRLLLFHRITVKDILINLKWRIFSVVSRLFRYCIPGNGE